MPTSSVDRRSRVTPLLDGIEIAVPARTGFYTLFLGAWLCGWIMGEIFAVREVTTQGGRDAFLVFWLLAWTFGGAWALATFLWSLLGRERLLATRDQLALIHELGPWRRIQRFDSKEVRALRVVDLPTGLEAMSRMPTLPFWGSGQGPLAFDYGFRTIRCGAGVSAAEARIIAGELSQHARLARSEGVPA